MKGKKMQKLHVNEIKLVQLDLDIQNYRIFDSGDQNEAIKLMVESEGIHIVEMGKDIVKEGLSPIDPLAVIKQTDCERYTVIEGNRRLTAIRLLENPKLALNPKIEAKFGDVSTIYLQRPFSNITCVIFPDKDTAMKWVDRKQGTDMKGAGLKKAGYVQNAFRKAQKDKFEKWYAAIIFLRENNFIGKQEFPERKIDKHNIGAVIQRVFGSAYLLENLGIKITVKGNVTFDNGKIKAGAELLKDILYDLIKVKPKTDDLKKIADQVFFLRKYLSRSVKHVIKPTIIQEHPPAQETADPNIQDHSPAQETIHSVPQGHPSTQETMHSVLQENPSGPNAKNPIVSDESEESIKEEFSSKDSAKFSIIKKKSLRKTLVPISDDTGLSIIHERINHLYHELRKLKITEDDNGQRVLAGVALRVFLELTLTHFLVKMKIPNPNGIGSWEDQRALITTKLSAVLEIIDPKSIDHELYHVRTAMGKGFHHSIEMFHHQVHSLHASILTQNECIEFWDRYEPLFIIIFDRINNDT